MGYTKLYKSKTSIPPHYIINFNYAKSIGIIIWLLHFYFRFRIYFRSSIYTELTIYWNFVRIRNKFNLLKEEYNMCRQTKLGLYIAKGHRSIKYKLMSVMQDVCILYCLSLIEWYPHCPYLKGQNQQVFGYL